jgi:hypothetical protein
MVLKVNRLRSHTNVNRIPESTCRYDSDMANMDGSDTAEAE